MDVIADGHCLEHLDHLLEFLAAWEKRPVNLTSMAYQWCCAIPKAATKLGLGKIPVSRPPLWWYSRSMEDKFSIAGHGCDPARLANTPLHQDDGALYHYTVLLYKSLKIGFRLAGPGRDQPAIRLGRASSNDQMFEAAFSSRDVEIIADAVCAWIADRDITPPNSLARYFTERVDYRIPFSRRLQWASTRAIECIWGDGLEVPGSETVRLLNRLEVNVDDVVDKDEWRRLLTSAIRSTTGQESLSSHHWRSLDRLISGLYVHGIFVSRNVEVMKLLEKAGDWERLEVWMVIVWGSLGPSERLKSEPMWGIEQTSRKLLSHRPSAIPRFENLAEFKLSEDDHLRPLLVDELAIMESAPPIGATLRRICSWARAGQLPSEPPPTSYVSVFCWSVSVRSNATFFLCFRQSVHVQSFVPLRFAGDDTF